TGLDSTGAAVRRRSVARTPAEDPEVGAPDPARRHCLRRTPAAERRAGNAATAGGGVGHPVREAGLHERRGASSRSLEPPAPAVRGRARTRTPPAWPQRPGSPWLRKLPRGPE